MIKSVPLHVCVYTHTHTHLQAQYEICLPFIFKSQASLKASWNLNMCTQMQLSQLRACFLLPFVQVLLPQRFGLSILQKHQLCLQIGVACYILAVQSLIISLIFKMIFFFFCFRKVFQHWISSMMLVLQVHFCSLLLQIRVFHCLPRISCSRRVCYLNGADGPLPRFLFQPHLRNRSNRGSHVLITECLSSIMVHLQCQRLRSVLLLQHNPCKSSVTKMYRVAVLGKCLNCLELVTHYCVYCCNRELFSCQHYFYLETIFLL